MKTKRLTEIAIESHRILILRQPGRLPEGWCQRCRKQVAVIHLGEAVQAGLNEQVITRQLEEGRFHFAVSGDGSSYICLSSLLQ